MRVLYVSSVYKPAYAYGGPARSVPSLCEGLAEAGAGIEVFTTDANRGERLSVPLARAVAVDGVPVTYFRLSANVTFILRPSCKLSRHQIRKFDVVEIDALFSSMLERSPPFAARWGIPYLIPPRGQLLHGALLEKRWKKRLYLKLAGLRTLKRRRGNSLCGPG